ncbi:hypothetical protein GCM10023322_19320 [Rugosimonospora acidiphila]|uniref:SPOR domain-containing protein n=1 Tax=Rugosimonospora acidiphila TaxID=556531 RepID=A0ABP9RP78_9ACTN
MPLASMYIAGPLIAFAMIGVLAAIPRWASSSDHKTSLPDRTTEDFGLLAPAATVEDQAVAQALRQLLGRAGIRATVAPAGDGWVHVLVFETELDRARRLTDGAI